MRDSDLPDGCWMTRRVRNMCMFFQDQLQLARFVIRDSDTRFHRAVSRLFLESEGTEVVLAAVRIPYQNAHAEWFMQTIKQECPDWLIVPGEKHLRYTIGKYAAHYNAE